MRQAGGISVGPSTSYIDATLPFQLVALCDRLEGEYLRAWPGKGTLHIGDDTMDARNAARRFIIQKAREQWDANVRDAHAGEAERDSARMMCAECDQMLQELGPETEAMGLLRKIDARVERMSKYLAEEVV